jgi:hypothetical protein
MKIQASMRSILFFGAAALALPTVAHAGAPGTGPVAARLPASPLLQAGEAQREQWMWAFAAARLQAVAADALGATAGGLPPPPPPPPLNITRKSITLLSATELASLRRGIAQMIAWNSAPHGSANFKRSLRYWANMHAYIGAGCSKDSGINYPGMSGLSLQSKATPDEIATWCTCQHGTIQFLTWHRMYLFYFEQVLQPSGITRLKAISRPPIARRPMWMVG